jgi:acyl-CoA synthetase (NDP forming)
MTSIKQQIKHYEKTIREVQAKLHPEISTTAQVSKSGSSSRRRETAQSSVQMIRAEVESAEPHEKNESLTVKIVGEIEGDLEKIVGLSNDVLAKISKLKSRLECDEELEELKRSIESLGGL